MKTPLFSLATLLAMAAASMAAPFINKQLVELEKKVGSDLAGGALTKADGDELKREIKEVRTVEDSEPSLTRKTRRDLREKVSKIQKDLERKETQGKALGSASPSATP